MPTSDSWGKEEFKQLVLRVSQERPIKRILDVGAGCGTYSDLLNPALPIEQFDAVEAWAPYIGQYNLHHKYDIVVPTDVRLLSPVNLNNYDLIIFGDVLEHMPKMDALKLIYSLHFPTAIAICIPVLHLEQGEVNGNPYEVHKMENHWTFDEMDATLKLMLHEAPGTYCNLEVIRGDVVAYFLMW